MGYHETYELFAIDHPLTAREMKALRALSTRATITPTRFSNCYEWGGLKGDPRGMLCRYFDLFIYTGKGVRGGACCGCLRIASMPVVGEHTYHSRVRRSHRRRVPASSRGVARRS